MPSRLTAVRRCRTGPGGAGRPPVEGVLAGEHLHQPLRGVRANSWAWLRAESAADAPARGNIRASWQRRAPYAEFVER
ncbi:hypothetical protein LT493_23990 [Streptomyces tricolor]|nr:hypothetical protein [Streptomyces tricolor]